MKLDIVSREFPVIIKDGHDFSNPTHILNGTAAPGEAFAFQICVLADGEYQGKRQLRLVSSGLEGDFHVPADDIFCVNFGGRDHHGIPFTKQIHLASMEQRTLWVTIPVPGRAGGKAEGSFTISLGDESGTVRVRLKAEGETVARGGADRPNRMTRLGWLNSDLALHGGPTGAYPPLRRQGDVLRILGRRLRIGSDGLPAEGYSFFDQNLRVGEKAQKVFGRMAFALTFAGGKQADFISEGVTFEPEDGEGIRYTAVSHCGDLRLEVKGRSEFDGWNQYEVMLTSAVQTDIADISMILPFEEGFETYMMGLGRKGGYRPECHDFHWNEEKHQSPVFIGGLNGGARVEFMGEDFVEPHVNIYYRHRPYHMSKSFCNGGKGGIRVEGIRGATLTAYSGSRRMEAGECLRFDFSILLTPLKELDTGKRFAARYDQSWDAVDCVEEANRAGANYINIHHANHANPYINYPFIEKDRLRALSDEIHAAGLKMKLYYTVREFSDYAYEMQPFLSLGDEIYPRPREGMESILWQPDTLKSFQQKYGETVIPAWKSDVDSALLTDGSSRLCNYYIEGLDYLAKEVDIDGIYLDDVAFDRVTMRRARRVLDLKEDCLIDLHSWNHYCEEAGWGNSLNIYMPLLPYIDSIWIGEGFDHQGEDEAFWIVEIAGLPFGMSGEILSEVQESQYRGMLFGITHRFMGLKVEPRYLWKFIDEYGIGHMELTGFWNEACPVKASDDRVKVSLYMDRASGKGAIAYASFAQEETTFVIEDGIGMQAMRMPPIKLFQEGRELAGGECIAVVPGGGGIIVFECKRNLLIVSDEQCDFTDVLESCGIRTTRIPFSEAVYMDLSGFDAFCILAARSGDVLEPRFRERLEAECAKGKRVFLQAVRSFQDNGCQGPVGTTRSRLIYVEPQDGEGIEGLDTGDLLDDEANLMCTPEYNLADMEPLLVYKEQIIAHTHTDMDRVEILKNCRYGMWRCGDNVLATAFVLRNFNKARFAPRRVWQVLISYIARWLTGNSPAFWPESVVQYGTKEDISVPEIFEKCRREAIERGITWMNGFLIDQGRGGIMEGTRHDIDPDGNQSILTGVRTDCVGECSGAYKMYAYLYGKKEYARLGEAMDDLVYGPMVVHGGACDGMMRWCTSGWGVCYQDDVARAILPGLYDSLFMKNDRRMAEICNVLDFLVRTTARDGLRVWRTDKYELTEQAMEALPEEEHGMASAHYNAYYLAALLLAARATGENRYLEMARRGLTSLMARYPDTVREQSETEEMCRLILPLAVLYKATGEEEHREMLYRVARDLQKVRHPFGGYMEWDSGYKAACSRESTGECSLLTENGDPIADLLYSSNWLPIGFAFAYDATGDQWFHTLWHDSVAFCLRTQIISENPLTNGSWCRAFDMEMQEAYAAPHDVGWACYGSESGWTNAEILMGIMMPEILSGSKKG